MDSIFIILLSANKELCTLNTTHKKRIALDPFFGVFTIKRPFPHAQRQQHDDHDPRLCCCNN